MPRRRPSARSVVITVVVAALPVAALAAAAFAGGRVAASKPVSVSPPVISGRPVVGQTLTVSNGGWNGSKPQTYTYQWLRCRRGACTQIGGATSNKHLVDTRDLGARLRVDVTAHNKDGKATARTTPTAVVTGDATAPLDTVPPSISGVLRAGQQLQVSPGTWTGTQPIAFSYAWERCPPAATKDVAPLCTVLAGSTGTTYVPSSADVGQRLRVRVTAKNSAGSTTAFTALSDLVGPAQGGSQTIDVAQVSPPDRLTADTVAFSPARIATRTPVSMRVRVVDNQGFLVQGALVYVVGIPYDRVQAMPETATGADGYATLTIVPTAKLSLARPGALVLFVRVRKPGDPLLGGVSSRRLVQIRVG